MIANIIRLIMTNIPLVMFFLAIIIPLLQRKNIIRQAEHYLSWMLLLSIGVSSLWAGLYHIFWPQTAAAFIGWESSPFQFEMGMSDFSLGVIAFLAFWRSLEFKSAIVILVSIEFSGLVYGHYHQLATTGDHQAGNAGILLGLTILHVFLLPILLVLSSRNKRKKSGLN